MEFMEFLMDFQENIFSNAVGIEKINFKGLLREYREFSRMIFCSRMKSEFSHLFD